MEEFKKKAELMAYLSLSEADKKVVQQTEFDAIKKSMLALVKKDNDQGKFEEKTGLVDTRTDQSLLSQ